MTSSTSATHCRVAVLTPTARIDVAVPSHLPVAELLPVVLDLARIADAGAGAGWRLGRVGRAALAPERSLADAGVRDGDLLDLRPAALFVPDPVFDEITDVAAAIAAESIGATRSVGRLSTAVTATALLLAATAWTWSNRAVGGSTAALVGALAMTAAAVAGRTRDAAGATGMGSAAVVLAAVAAAGHTTADPATWSTAGAALLVAGPVMALGIRTGTAVFTALTVVGGMLLAVAVVSRSTDWPPHHLAVGAMVVAVSALPTVPRWAARISGLRRPTTAADTADTTLSDARLASAVSASRRALEIAAGMNVAFACAVGAGAVVLAGGAEVWSTALAVVGPAVLLFRTRAVHVPRQQMALATPALAALITVGVIVGPQLPSSAQSGSAIAAGAISVGLILSRTAAAQWYRSPGGHRVLRWLETAAVIALMPIAVAAVGGYELVRHL